jgi:hypothetical protein
MYDRGNQRFFTGSVVAFWFQTKVLNLSTGCESTLAAAFGFRNADDASDAISTWRDRQSAVRNVDRLVQQAQNLLAKAQPDAAGLEEAGKLITNSRLPHSYKTQLREVSVSCCALSVRPGSMSGQHVISSAVFLPFVSCSG